MEVIFKGIKSNLNDLSVTEDSISDVVSYIFVVTASIGEEGECDTGHLKNKIMLNENTPQIGDDHPIIHTLKCTSISVTQLSNDSSKEFAISVDVTFSSDTSDLIDEDSLQYLFDYKRSVTPYEVPFELAYNKYYPVKDGDIKDKDTPKTIQEKYKTKTLDDSWAQLYKKKDTTTTVNTTTTTTTEETKKTVDANTKSVKVINSTGDRINAKTIDHKISYSFNYYADKFDAEMAEKYLNTTNTADISFEDVTIEAFTGIVKKIDYEYVILRTSKTEDGKTTYYQHKKVKVSVEIEVNKHGVGQRLGDMSFNYYEPSTETKNYKIIGLQRIYTDNTGKYGTFVIPNEIKIDPPDKIEYKKHSNFGAKDLIENNINIDFANGVINDNKYSNYMKNIVPIDKPVPITSEGRIATYYNSDRDVEEFIMMYIDYLDVRPIKWKEMGFENKTTENYMKYKKTVEQGG